jgi:hypothetical protein
MYRNVHIDRNSMTLWGLDMRVSHLSDARGINIWRWVWSLYVDEDQSSDNEIMTLLTKTVFTKTVNLRLIELNILTPVRSEHLVTLRQCCPSLRSLRIRFNPGSYGAMAQVGLFEHVQRLNIATARPISRSQKPMEPLTDVPSWNMPAVTRFSWFDHRSPIKLSHEAEFMSRCRFPRLTHLDIMLGNRYASLEAMRHICGLLDAHRNIRTLGIMVRDDWYPTIVPFVRAPILQITCNSRCPPRAFVPLLRPEVKTLELKLSSSTWDHEERELPTSLWELLAQFEAEDGTLPTLETIRLSANDVDGKPKPTAEEKFLHTLRFHVPALNARGIRLFVDDDQIRKPPRISSPGRVC